MRDSNKISVLGKIIAVVGLACIGISGYINLNNLDRKGTPNYNISCRDNTLYSMMVGGVGVIGGLSLLSYS